MFSLDSEVICPSQNSISKAKKSKCRSEFLSGIESIALKSNQMEFKLLKDRIEAETIFAKCYGHVGSCKLLFLMG